MHTDSSSCLPRTQGAIQTEDPKNGEDAQQSNATHQLSDKGLEVVKFNNVNVPINVAYDRAVAYVEAGKGNWRRTRMKIQDSAVFAFHLSCATCEKRFSMKNPSSCWVTHSKTCKDNGARSGFEGGRASSQLCKPPRRVGHSRRSCPPLISRKRSTDTCHQWHASHHACRSRFSRTGT
jgi:hypothetical protein